MSKDILINERGDLVITNYDLSITTREQVTKQKLIQRLSTFKGEWFLNLEAGIPYFEEILGKNNSISRIETLFIREIQKIEEVTEILKLNINENKATRRITIELAVKDNLNNIIEITL